MPDQKHQPQEHQPQDNDAVLGGQSPAPSKGAILGGIEEIKRRLLHQKGDEDPHYRYCSVAE